MYEYYFAVNTDDDKGVPFGPVNKENMDISRLLVDFTCWLDPSESITAIGHLAIEPNPPQSVPPWQSNYPLDEFSSVVIPTDTYPLDFVRQSVINSGKAVALDMSAGTPGLTYAVSFSATAGVSVRRRLVYILMAIDMPLNPAMVAVSEGAMPTYSYPLIINVSTVLPFGFTGTVYVENISGAALAITLPQAPVLGHSVAIKDVTGNSGEFWITITGADGATIDKSPSLVLRAPFSAATLEWSGSGWSQMS